MIPSNHIPTHRTLRLHEWLLLLALMGLIGGVRAAPIYKCIDAEGNPSYQDIACPAQTLPAQFELAPEPAFAPSPHYALEREADNSPQHHEPKPSSRRGADTGYECRASDGEVFYRLGGCPRSIAAGSDGTTAGKKGGKKGSAGTVTVSARPIPRAEACAEMRRAGAVGRSGHEHDETVSTYDRNLGRDPCR